MQKAIRIALVSTPRSGNTWLRNLIAELYGLEQLAVHDPNSIDWCGLGDQVIVQVHWDRTAEFVSLLKRSDFQVVTIARHPLDVLISILHFAPNEPQTANWLLGKCGNELSIYGKVPESLEFVDYCLSERAKALLAVTPQWWGTEDVISVRYEELVKDAESALIQLRSRLQTESADLGTVLVKTSLNQLRKTAANQHFWKGQPGLWRQLLTSGSARQIMQTHSDTVLSLGYGCEADENLSAEAAINNWLVL